MVDLGGSTSGMVGLVVTNHVVVELEVSEELVEVGFVLDGLVGIQKPLKCLVEAFLFALCGGFTRPSSDGFDSASA